MAPRDQARHDRTKECWHNFHDENPRYGLVLMVCLLVPSVSYIIYKYYDQPDSIGLALVIDTVGCIITFFLIAFLHREIVCRSEKKSRKYLEQYSIH
jgi:hypothetical protein